MQNEIVSARFAEKDVKRIREFGKRRGFVDDRGHVKKSMTLRALVKLGLQEAGEERNGS